MRDGAPGRVWRGAGAGSARSRCGLGPPRFARAPRGPRSLWDLGWASPPPAPPSRQPSAGGAWPRRGEERGARPAAPLSRAEARKGGGSIRAPARALAAPPGEAARLAGGARLGWPVPALARHPGAGGLGGARREAAGRPGSLAPVPTSRVSHGWSEVLFLKRLQGGHRQPPTSLPMRAVDCQPCVGPGAWAVHLAGGAVGQPGYRPGVGGWGEQRGAPTEQVAGRGPSSPGLEAQGQKAGKCYCPAAGKVSDQSSPRWRKL